MDARESAAMNQAPQHSEQAAKTRSTHDGLAAVAISLLFVALVIFMITQLI